MESDSSCICSTAGIRTDNHIWKYHALSHGVDDDGWKGMMGLGMGWRTGPGFAGGWLVLPGAAGCSDNGARRCNNDERTPLDYRIYRDGTGFSILGAILGIIGGVIALSERGQTIP